MASGCRGLAVGRRIFSAPSPAALVSRLAAVVHGGGNEIPDDMGMSSSSTIVAGVA
jgi:2-amino-4,5-dihydroxy-6-oxo-7-(phosphonooxy)heptanoate synthase